MWLKEGKYTGGKRYVFKEYWSKVNHDGTRMKGAYKIRVMVAEAAWEDPITHIILETKPLQMELVI
jgi:hypothetical protein